MKPTVGKLPLLFCYNSPIGEYGIIQSTNYYRYYVEEKGWVSAIQLQMGDYLCTIEGEHVEITSVEKERQEEGVVVYNFLVEDWESWYVHNDSCDPKKRNGKGDPRDLPGIVKGGKKLNDIDKMMRGSQGNIGLISKDIGDNLKGKSFKNFKDFRG